MRRNNRFPTWMSFIINISDLFNLVKYRSKHKSPKNHQNLLFKTLPTLTTQLRPFISSSWWRNLFIWKIPLVRVINPDCYDARKKPTVKEFALFFTHQNISLGNSQHRDITIRSECISRDHIDIIEKNIRILFFVIKRRYLKDKNSTNGTYKQKHWWCWQPCIPGKDYLLWHGDVFLLGHPKDPLAVKIKYIDPPPLPIKLLFWIRNSLLGLIVLFIAIFLGILLNWSNIPGDILPKISASQVIIYASDHQTPLNIINKEKVEEIKDIRDFPPNLINAIIASEDSRYYSHIGIDSIGLLRAFLNNVILKREREGGSTITQQVARTLFPEWVGRTYSLERKLKEAVVAIKLNLLYSKQQILLTYLNSVFIGRDINGFNQAAQHYFGKSFKKLDLVESATLVAMLPSPNGFDLCRTHSDSGLKDLKARRKRVIERMQEQGFIKSSTEAKQAKFMPVLSLFSPNICLPMTQEKTVIPLLYNNLIDRELDILMQEEAKEGNLIIETTLDLEKQKQAQLILESTIKNQGKNKGISQGSLVSIDSRTGGIVALVAAVEPQKPTFVFNKDTNKQEGPYFYDYATVEQLSPGSTFKIFAYTAALEKGILPNKTYSCNRFDFHFGFKSERFIPNQLSENYCGVESNNINMQTAMAFSDNITALKVAQDAGLDRVISTAKRMGITSNLEPAVPRIVLGQSPVTLMDITGAYGVLANHGIANKPHIINRIIDISSRNCDQKNYNTDKNCPVLYSYQGDPLLGVKADRQSQRQVLSSTVADKMTGLLRGVVTNGTARNVTIKSAVGKTGTSDQSKDLWFIGYIPGDLVTGVWIGNPTTERHPTQAASKDAAQIWNDYMQKIGYK